MYIASQFFKQNDYFSYFTRKRIAVFHTVRPTAIFGRFKKFYNNRKQYYFHYASSVILIMQFEVLYINVKRIVLPVAMECDFFLS